MILDCKVGDITYKVDPNLKLYRRSDWEETEWHKYDHLTPWIPEVGVALYIDHGDGSYRMTGLVEGIQEGVVS